MDIQAKLRKELRFVTSAEQMIPFLNRIRATNDSDDQSADNISDTNESADVVDPSMDETSKINKKLTTAQPAISAAITSAAIALPNNVYEEYVNFIDLSVLNPIIDATNCQPDTLIESEISELWFFLLLFFMLCVHRISEE